MALLAIPILLQVISVVHVIRTGRNQGWIMAIVMLPVAGSIAYFVMEVLPTMGSNRHVRTARARVGELIDPERDLREARAALEVADTPANRVALADALAAQERFAEALPLYRDALAMVRTADPPTQLKLARALYRTGAYDDALALLGTLPATTSIGEGDRRALLRAEILTQTGGGAEALGLYADIVTRLPGVEARCRYAALLLEHGERGRARAVLEEVEKQHARADRHRRAAEREMYDWALRELAGLRG